MNRLTKRNGIGYIARNKFCDYNAVLNDNELESAYRQCVEKLGQYEDTDEKLGIEYPILIKALTEGFYAKYLNEIEINRHIYFSGYQIKPDFIRRIIVCDDLFIFYFKDYGKTWFLTKEELQNEK